MRETDTNGLIDGMTPAEYSELQRFMASLNKKWARQINHTDIEIRSAALSELAIAADHFRAFTPAQHHNFIAEWWPTLPLSSILPILQAFGLATPIA